ncbi:MAG: aromatic amino acid transaminase, partial [Planctomycetota bacterium]
MLDQVTPTPPDPILGISEAYAADPNPAKINLSVGVFKDADGKTPVLESVKAAERAVLDQEASKGYMPIDGDPGFGRAVRALLWGDASPLVDGGRARTANTPGGTGALRVAADYLHQNHPGATVWLPDPTWANHQGIFEAAGVPTAGYPYLDGAGYALGLDDLLHTVRGRIPAGDVVLLHGCCHNPTGVDPSPEQWATIAATVAERGLLPLVDFAYQGFGRGLDEDAAGLRAVTDACDELLVCSSYSKNFGLYRDRVGALTVVTAAADQAAAVMSRVKAAVRRNYSNPPAHGAQVVAHI